MLLSVIIAIAACFRAMDLWAIDSPLIYDGSPSLLDSPLIPSTVAVAKSAIKSNPVTRTTSCQRQAKRPTVDSPTSSVLSPIKKRRLLVEDSGEVKIAVTERKVCCPEDLLVSNGFKLSVYYTDQPCQVPNCKDPACVFGHTCKCGLHKSMGDVLKGGCFSLFKYGLCTASCLYKSKCDRITTQRRAEVTSTDYLLSLKIEQLPSESQLHTAGKIHKHRLSRYGSIYVSGVISLC